MRRWGQARRHRLAVATLACGGLPYTTARILTSAAVCSCTAFRAAADPRVRRATGQIQRWYAYGTGPDEVLGQVNVAANTPRT